MPPKFPPGRSFFPGQNQQQQLPSPAPSPGPPRVAPLAMPTPAPPTPPPPRPPSIASMHSNDSASESDEDEGDEEEAAHAAEGPARGDTLRADIVDRFPALNLITALLRAVGAGEGEAKRGARVRTEAVASASAVYTTIVAAVDELQGDKAGTAAERRFLFDGYTAAAYILEVFLLSLPKTYYIPSADISLALPPTTGTKEAIAYIHSRISEREQLNKSLDTLRAQGIQLQFLGSRIPNIINFDYASHRLDDDKSIVKDISAFLKKSTVSDKDIIQAGKSNGTLVADVLKSSSRVADIILQQSIVDIQTNTYVIRALLIVYIPFAMLGEPSTTLAWRTYLRSAPVWEAVDGLLLKVLGLPTKSKASMGQELNGEFERVERLLQTLGDVTIDTAPEIAALRADIASQTPRAFFYRTVAIVQALDHLDRYSLEPKAKHLNGHRHPLKLAMQDTQNELHAVFKNAQLDVKSFSIEAADYQNRGAKVKKTFSQLASLFKDFEIGQEWSKQESGFEEKTEHDEKNMLMGKAMLGG